MTTATFTNMHQVGEGFSYELFHQARRKTIAAVHQLASLIQPGISETEGHDLIHLVLKEAGAEKFWHPHKFRIGANTLKSFRELSEPGVTLGDEDIFFLDIGPVFEGHEGDYGETFVCGSNPEHLKLQAATREVFSIVEQAWREQDLTGQELYAFADKTARSNGYVLNDKMAGHRLGDFPHHLHYRGGLADIEGPPQDQLWVLEIHLRHPTLALGGFFEDIIQKSPSIP